MDENRVDFFVSHAGRDSAWAEWVAWQLTEAGYSVELDVWDWAAGRNFVTEMADALDRSHRLLALFSAAYFDRSRYTTQEWSASILHVAGVTEDRLLPLRVEDFPAQDMPAILRPLLTRDLFGLPEEQARQVLLDAVTGPHRPDHKPAFPGQGTASGPYELRPRLPGTAPRVWNVPTRNAGFTGRDELLATVRERLIAHDRVVVQALHGIGGVGKTQLAVEYAHRFASEYDLVWWIASEQAGLIGDHFAGLAAELGCAPPDAETTTVQRAVFAELRAGSRWLLVFDNAENPEDLAAWLPFGTGHVLITSRSSGWAEFAGFIEVDVLTRTESTAILGDRVSDLSAAEAGQLAEELGDLPLAVVQAAGYLADTGMSASSYMHLLATRATEILDLGKPHSYPHSLAAATHLTVDRLAVDTPAAAELAMLCAFMAPEPIPTDLFTAAVRHLPRLLAAKAADPLKWSRLVSMISRTSIVRVDQRGLHMHRLTKAILCDHLPRSRVNAMRASAEAMLTAGHPGDPSSPVSWPGWGRILPHLLAVGPASSGNPDFRDLACNACWYLLMRGETTSGHDMALYLHQEWSGRLGADDRNTLWAANSLAHSYRISGRFREAKQLDEDTLARRKRVLGMNNRRTLISATNLAIDLFYLEEVQAARELDEKTLARSKHVLGDDHPCTLMLATNLAEDLRALGEVQAARELSEDNLSRCKRVLGDDDPQTIAAATNLARDLRELGEVQKARELDEVTLALSKRVLGDDHPSTLELATNLAEDLRKLGGIQAARELKEET